MEQPYKQYKQSQGISLGLALALLLFLLAGLTACQNPLDSALSPLDPPLDLGQAQEGETAPGDNSATNTGTGEHTLVSPVPGSDAQLTVDLLRTDGRVETLSLQDYLWGVVSVEMPASFPLESLKAQAVAARTFTAGRLLRGTKHPTGQVCDYSGCCQAYYDREQRLNSWPASLAEDYDQIITQAIAETDGLYVLYQDSLIDAVFFSSASGQTLDAQAVWGNATPYLLGVDSPEGDEVPNYHSQVILSQEEVRQLTLARYPAADLSAPPSTWFQDLQQSATGIVAQANLGGVTLTGTQLRSLFSLRSPAFFLEYQEESFVFSVTGYGHGVGMSQYGAKALAEQGQNFQQILCWYYSDTQIAPFDLGLST